jgi:hypothetical protein
VVERCTSPRLMAAANVAERSLIAPGPLARNVQRMHHHLSPSRHVDVAGDPQPHWSQLVRADLASCLRRHARCAAARRALQPAGSADSSRARCRCTRARCFS